MQGSYFYSLTMNQNHFDECTLALLDECKELLITKGKDYSSETDKLANFKEAELFTSCDRWEAWEIYFFKHIQAIQNYFRSGRKPLSESIHHRIRDAINYLVLLEALLVEEEKDAKNEKPKGIKDSNYQCESEAEFIGYEAYPETKQILRQKGYSHYSWEGETKALLAISC